MTGNDNVSDSPKVMCEVYESLSRKEKYGIFSRLAVFIGTKSQAWCVRHYRSVFKRALFPEKITSLQKACILRRARELYTPGTTIAQVVNEVQKQFELAFVVDLYCMIHHHLINVKAQVEVKTE